MRTFFSVFRFEFLNYVKSKGFLGITIFLIVAIGIALTIPALISGVEGHEAETPAETSMVISGITQEELALFQSAFPGSVLELSQDSEQELSRAVENGSYDSAVIVTGELSYKYLVKNIGLYDVTQSVMDEVMVMRYRLKLLQELGANAQETEQFMTAQAESQVVQSQDGKDQMSNFMYTYILIFALYMVILLYGQFVATGVANEKSSRAMELLITSANTKHLLFGKVLGTGCAGLLQFVLIFGSAYLFYNLNSAFYESSAVMQSIFNMPLELLLYAFLFLVLGFFIYAFIYGALGSVVSRIEQLNTAVMPATFIFVFAFIVVVFSMSSGNVDTVLMKVVSFIPLTSPMAMFTRIALGTVAGWEIVLSVLLLIAATVAMGFLAAGIYRMGVLMYGQPPKLGQLLKMLRNQKK